MYIVVFVTVSSIKEARKISAALIKQKLAACVNIINGVNSVFWWQGKVDSSKELLLIVKTRKALFKKVEKVVKTLHSYKVPEIIALPIFCGSRQYLRWINDSVRKSG